MATVGFTAALLLGGTAVSHAYTNLIFVYPELQAGGIVMQNPARTKWGTLTVNLPPGSNRRSFAEMTFTTNAGNIALWPQSRMRAVFQPRAPHALKTGGGNWGLLSDGRAKKDVGDFTLGVNELTQLRPRTFKYNGSASMAPDDGVDYVGLVAQEVPNILSFMVKPDPTDRIDGQPILTVNSEPLTFVLVNAVKEQARTIRAMRSRVQQLREIVCADQPYVMNCKPATK